MDLRKKRRGRGRLTARVRIRVKAAEVVREGHCFAVVDDLPLCSGLSRSVGEIKLGEIFQKDSVQEAALRESQSVPAGGGAQSPRAES